MLIQDISSIDLLKYKRLFVFGCSFTNYRWPTWADILHKEMPNSEFFNFGQAGAGNLFIAASIMEANERYKFTETDLIIPQWSTYFREDKYIEKEWITPGNIFAQHDAPDEAFALALASIRGYLIRDMALITSVRYSLSAWPCDSIMLSSIIADSEMPRDIKIDDVILLYTNTINSMQTPMTELLRLPGDTSPFPWPVRVRYINNTEIHRKPYMIEDYHPGPLLYHLYLKKLNFNLTAESLIYAQSVDNIIDSVTIISELECNWQPHLLKDKRL